MFLKNKTKNILTVLLSPQQLLVCSRERKHMKENVKCDCQLLLVLTPSMCRQRRACGVRGGYSMIMSNRLPRFPSPLLSPSPPFPPSLLHPLFPSFPFCPHLSLSPFISLNSFLSPPSFLKRWHQKWVCRYTKSFWEKSMATTIWRATPPPPPPPPPSIHPSILPPHL